MRKPGLTYETLGKILKIENRTIDMIDIFQSFFERIVRMGTLPKYVAEILKEYQEDFPPENEPNSVFYQWIQKDGSLIEMLTIDDTRQQAKCKYSIQDILFITITAAVCGISSFLRMAEFVQYQKSWFEKYIDLSHGAPDGDTIRRILNLISPKTTNYISQSIVNQLTNADNSEHVAIDGKSVKGCYNTFDNRIEHSVSAWLSKLGVSLGQTTTKDDQGKEEGEYQAVPKLLQMLDIAGKTVTMDAGGCYHALLEPIVQRGGEYIVQVKKNQMVLYNKCVELFSDVPVTTGTWEKGHGRIEKREYTTISFTDDKWLTARSITRVISTRKTKGQTSVSERYYISSLDSSAQQDIANKIRSHWSIENQLHWSLDVTFNEDSQRTRTGNNVENLIILRRLGISLLNIKTGNKKTTSAIHRACFDEQFRSEVIEQVFNSK